MLVQSMQWSERVTFYFYKLHYLKYAKNGHSNISLTFDHNRNEPQPTPPLFDKQPVGGQFVEGEDAVLECKVSGYPSPHITWIKEGRELSNGNKLVA